MSLGLTGKRTFLRGGAIFLVGFMGAGKSSIGRALGQHFDCEFEDLDDRIERVERRSITEIFRTSGEVEFRIIERAALRQVLRELANDEMRIVGLGGGAFVQAENATLLKDAGILTVFLDAPVGELWRRCAKQAEAQGLTRPLLQSPEQFYTLFEARRPDYMKASLRVATGGRTMETIVHEIAEALEAKGFGKIENKTIKNKNN